MISFRCRFGAQQSHAQVIDIGAGGAGKDQPVHARKGVIGIVLRQDLRNGKALPGQCGGGRAVHKTARGVRGAVCAVGAHGKHGGARLAGNTGGRGEGKLLIPSALAAAVSFTTVSPPKMKASGSRFRRAAAAAPPAHCRHPWLAVHMVADQNGR